MSETKCDQCGRVIREDEDMFAVSWRPKGSHLWAVDVDVCSTECLAGTAVSAARRERRMEFVPDPEPSKRRWWQR